ncbi:MAG: TrmH family RNA methyltransferase [Gammaproteobacteria bacterium]
MERITSDHNPLLKLGRRLIESSRDRRKHNKTVLDGAHLVQAYADRFGLEQASIIVSDTGLQSAEIRELLAKRAPGRLLNLPDALFASLSPVETPTGMLAIVEIPRVERRARAGQEFWLLLDGIQDPGNVGSILRTAAASGATRALLSPSCADPWSPKCLRGGMGAQLVLPIADHADLWAMLETFTGKIYATAARTGTALFEVDLKGECAVLFGGEGTGLGKDLMTQADSTIQIPIADGVESLNVAASAAMVCYERIRQLRSR